MSQCCFHNMWLEPCREEAEPGKFFCQKHQDIQDSHIKDIPNTIERVINSKFYITSNNRLRFHKYGCLSGWFVRQIYQTFADYLM